MKKDKKVGPSVRSRSDDQEGVQVVEGSQGVLKLVGDPREEILEFCTQIAKQTIMLSEWENTIDGMLRTIAFMVRCTEVFEMMEKIQMLVQDWAKVASREEENKALCQECERLWMDVWKAESHANDARNRVDASRRTLIEVKDALTLPVDVVNKARLFNERLEREDKVSRGYIIRYLNDEARKMEKTWEQIKLPVENSIPERLVQQGT